MDFQILIESYPKSNFVISYIIEGTEHIVLFDERPEQFGVQMRKESRDVLFILPAYFNIEVLSSSEFVLLIAEIVVYGRILVGNKSQRHTLSLFFQIFLDQKFLRLDVSKRKLLKTLKLATNYLSNLPRIGNNGDANDLKKTILELYFPCSQSFFAVNRSAFTRLNVPRQVYSVLNEDVGVDFVLNLCQSILLVNKFIEDRSILLYYINLQNDYDDILIILSRHCKIELEMLAEKSKLFFWMDTDSQTMKIKVSPPKSEYKTTLRLLRLIDIVLYNNFGKQINKLPIDKLYKEQESYILSNHYIEEYELDLVRICLTQIIEKSLCWNQKNALDAFLKIMIPILDELNISDCILVTRSIFNERYRERAKVSSPLTYREFEKSIGSRYSDLHNWYCTFSLQLNLDEKFNGEIVQFAKNLINKYMNCREESFLTLTKGNNIYVDSEFCGYSNSIVAFCCGFFNTLSSHFGLDEEQDEKASYVLLQYFANKIK